MGIFIVFIDQGQEGLLFDVRRLIVLDGIKAQLLGGLLLGGHIAYRGRIFADQNGHQAGHDPLLGLQVIHFFFQFLANLFGNFGTADDFRRHKPSPFVVPICLISKSGSAV